MDDESSEAARARAVAEQTLQSIFLNHPDGVFAIDLEGRFTAINPAAEELSGYAEAELVGRSFVELLPDDGAVSTTADVFARLLERESAEFEVAFLEKGGDIAELEIVGLPIVVDDEVVGIYGIAKNVTERRRLALAVEDARAAAEASDQTKSVFLATMSHEIRTPLASALAAVELLGDSDLDDTQRRLVSVMERSADRLLRLISQVLDFSRIEAGHTEVVRVPLSVHTLVADALQSQANALSAGVELTADIRPDVPDRLLGDPMLVGQVLDNLVANAVKFTESGSVRVSAELEMTAGVDVWVRFQIADTGIGMTAQQAPAVFEPFHQADPSITRRYGGTGLGLAIVDRVVAELGGRLYVESELGVGSTFTVVVPFGEPARFGSPADEPARGPDTATVSAPRQDAGHGTDHG